MNKKEQQAQRARQEDEILTKVLWWIVGSVVLEALLLLLGAARPDEIGHELLRDIYKQSIAPLITLIEEITSLNLQLVFTSNVTSRNL